MTNFNEMNLLPHFQPIISIDNNSIYGYEILGRYIDNEKNVQSLGSFFSDPTVSNESALQVDRIIREKGIKEFADLGNNNEYLFINMRLAWLMAFSKNPEKMPTIQWANKYGVDFNRIVIEITEEDINNCTDFYLTSLSYYRSLGFRIAIDDYGCKNSNIYRLAELCPEIIKIDMSFVHKSEEFYQYRHYLKFLTEFAENLGIEVIYEGVENGKQLLNCINSHGRFYQGFYLAKPLPSIKEASFDIDAFKRNSFTAIVTKQSSIEKIKGLQHNIDRLISTCLANNPFDQCNLTIDEYISDLCDVIPSYVIRIYVCNKYGYQISSNIEFGDGTISITDYCGRNWAWRGYFVKALTAIDENQPSFLTQEYRDVSSKEKIYTYVRKVSSTNYLFVDISKDDME